MFAPYRPPMTATTDTWRKCGADMHHGCGAISVRVNATCTRRQITAYGDRLLFQSAHEDLVRDWVRRARPLYLMCRLPELK